MAGERISGVIEGFPRLRTWHLRGEDAGEFLLDGEGRMRREVFEALVDELRRWRRTCCRISRNVCS